MEASHLVFTFDSGSNEGPSVSFSRGKPCPGPTVEPLASLVKSTFTEIEGKELAAIRHKPLLSLVKSLSTELSHSKPEVSQSRSDSQLNLHLWKQLTQPKGGDGDWKMASASPASLSPPAEARGGFFKTELEDTRRMLSEAMQDPFSMLSKIMGDEAQVSPRQQEPGAVDHSDHQESSGCSEQANGETEDLETQRRDMWFAKGTPVSSNTFAKKHKRDPSGHWNSRYEIHTFGDIIQVVEVQRPLSEVEEPAKGFPVPSPPRSRCSVPGGWLFCIGALAYSLFVLPLPSYLSGLLLGLACGFVMGLLVVLLLAPRCPTHPSGTPEPVTTTWQSNFSSSNWKDPKVLEGWMNEMPAYDPETYHPSLTHSVFAVLEGSRLRLAYPSSNLPRRAAFGEQPPEVIFVGQRCYQLAGSKVFLWPPALAHKRMWKQKYPICIVLARREDAGDTPVEEEQIHQQMLGTNQSGLPNTLYLFGRTGRQKEEWFQHLLSASKLEDQGSHDEAVLHDSSPAEVSPCGGGSCKGSAEDLPSLLHPVREKLLLDYNMYMARFVVQENFGVQPSPSISSLPSPTGGSPATRKQLPCDTVTGAIEAQTAWINALVGRIFWDFLREKYWSDQVAHKIQKKLSKIRLPYFMNELTLTELDMGSSMPQATNTSKPYVDHRGLWLGLNVVYTGSLQMTLETKMNLCKLGKESSAEASCSPKTTSKSSRPKLCVLADSDEESSSAGSSEEEEIQPSEPQETLGDKSTPPGTDGHSSGSTSRKILRFVDKIAKSKYFQKATENEYIKKKIVEVSNMPLLLSVEVRELSGTLMVNIPPPPTDRIWYDFHTPPRLDLRVRPMLGEREVTFTHVTEWIERKLQREFQKVFVMPNMDDLYLPLMHSGLEHPTTSQQSLARSSWQSSEGSPDKEEDSVSV
ncbi:testis-expressed sequence 2 protein-like isoform X1 [Arapaima gigas]